MVIEDYGYLLWQQKIAQMHAACEASYC